MNSVKLLKQKRNEKRGMSEQEKEEKEKCNKAVEKSVLI